MLEQTNLDAVVNLTNIPAHAATTLKILESGRHCVSEKPLATTLHEANALVEAAQRRNQPGRALPQRR